MEWRWWWPARLLSAGREADGAAVTPTDPWPQARTPAALRAPWAATSGFATLTRGRPVEPGGPAAAVDLRGWRAPSIGAAQVAVERCAVGTARGYHLQMHQSAAVAVAARQTAISRSIAWLVTGGSVRADRVVAQWIAGGLIETRRVLAFAIVGGKINGDVRCLLDTRGAFAFGAGLALTGWLLRSLWPRRGRG